MFNSFKAEDVTFTKVAGVDPVNAGLTGVRGVVTRDDGSKVACIALGADDSVTRGRVVQALRNHKQ